MVAVGGLADGVVEVELAEEPVEREALAADAAELAIVGDLGDEPLVGRPGLRPGVRPSEHLLVHERHEHPRDGVGQQLDAVAPVGVAHAPLVQCRPDAVDRAGDGGGVLARDELPHVDGGTLDCLPGGVEERVPCVEPLHRRLLPVELC